MAEGAVGTYILASVPRFGTTDRMDAPPLKTSEKFKLFAKTSLDPVTIFIAAARAGVSQADGQFKQYGQGAEGYGKQFRRCLRRPGIERILPYISLSDHLQTGSTHTSGWGMADLFIASGYSLSAGESFSHTDSGGDVPSTLQRAGSRHVGWSLQRVLSSPDDRGFTLTMSRSGLALAYAAGGNLLSEFWPDIRRKVFKRK